VSAGARVLRLAMVGGGEGAYIGGTHRIAARFGNHFHLVAGAFDVDPTRGRRFAEAMRIAPERAYDDAEALVAGEAARDDRADVVAICTPNHTHYPIARTLLEGGFDVICEKPLTTSLEDALALERLAERTNRFVGVAYVYSAYPMIHEARARVAAGQIGTVRLVQAEYQHQWMARPLEGSAQAAWRMDPARSGRGGAIADIGTHAYHLATFVTGLTVEALFAEAWPIVPGRVLDDAAHVLLRFHGGARGLLWCSQVSPGCANGLRLRVFGSEGGLDWFQERPDELVLSTLDGGTTILRRGAAGLSDASLARGTTPPGHPEGYLEAFANLYAGFAEVLRARAEDREPNAIGRDVPTVTDGVKGVAFVEAVVDGAAAPSPTWITPVRS
jgi:predicted dehydrogenase